MSVKFGPEIRVDGVRPAWLKQTDTIQPKTNCGWTGVHDGAYPTSSAPLKDWAWSHSDGKPCIIAIRLPATHFAYTVFAYNDKHGTDFYPWAGGDSAPEDWDGGEVLTDEESDATLCPTWVAYDWSKRSRIRIIGYTLRKTPQEVPQAPADTRMTEGDALRLIARHNGDHIAILRELGMIRDDETQARIAAETGVKLSDVSRVIAAYEGMGK